MKYFGKSHFTTFPEKEEEEKRRRRRERRRKMHFQNSEKSTKCGRHKFASNSNSFPMREILLQKPRETSSSSLVCRYISLSLSFLLSLTSNGHKLFTTISAKPNIHKCQIWVIWMLCIIKQVCPEICEDGTASSSGPKNWILTIGFSPSFRWRLLRPLSCPRGRRVCHSDWAFRSTARSMRVNLKKEKKKPFISQLDGGVLSWRQRDCWLRFEFLPNLNGASKKVRKQEGMTARSECNVIVKCTNSRRNISSLGIGSGCSRFESDMYLYLLLNFYVESWKRLLYIFVATSMQWSRPLFSFVFIFSIQLTVNVQCKCCQWLDSNRGPLELKATALPTEQQPDL